jgi:hypothetical protein
MTVRARFTTFVRVFAALALLALGAACAPSMQQLAAPPPHGVEFRDGRWFDGTRFVERTMYVADGVFHERAPLRVDSVVDLGGGYVIPPFGDAHYHLIDPRIEVTTAAFLREGIFYVRDPTNAPIMRRAIAPLFNKPAAVDYVSANQGWTSPGGHPVEVARRGAQMPGPMGQFVRDSLDPGVVMQVDTKEDIEKRWPYFLAGRPDFVKLYLLQSENHARRRNDPRAEGDRGLDPALVPDIVRMAHAAGLPVAAHVYTAADFRAAVNGGVDIVAHLPGGRGTGAAPFLLTAADAASARLHGVAVITTVGQHGDSALADRLMREQHGPNIRLLRAHGVPLLLGSDLQGSTAAREAAILARSGLFTPLELLRMWSIATPQSIFPRRRIGVLAEGYEASFLVLRADPLSDFRNTGAITRRVKQGVAVP